MILVPVSVGELIDKLSILEIKKNKITDIQKISYVQKEFEVLSKLSQKYLERKEIFQLYERLIEINTKLWNVEDEIREFESKGIFDQNFIKLAREVYITNDERFTSKDQINNLTNSEIKEVKNYKQY